MAFYLSQFAQASQIQLDTPFMRFSIRIATMLFVLVSSCVGVSDPGWSYRAETGSRIQEDGTRYDVTDPLGQKLRVYASAFTIHLDVEVDFAGFTSTDQDGSMLAVDVIDAFGESLPRDDPNQQSVACQTGGRPDAGFAADSVVCTVRGRFKIKPFGRAGCGRNSALDTITVVVSSTASERLTKATARMVAY